MAGRRGEAAVYTIAGAWGFVERVVDGGGGLLNRLSPLVVRRHLDRLPKLAGARRKFIESRYTT
jgi:hypothetical protein